MSFETENENENNDSKNLANSFGSNFFVTGNLFSSSDIDYFSLAATAAGTVSISFDPTVNSSYTEYYTVSLLDSSGTVLASQDVGKDTNFSAGVGSAGTYYFSVAAYST